MSKGREGKNAASTGASKEEKQEGKEHLLEIRSPEKLHTQTEIGSHHFTSHPDMDKKLLEPDSPERKAFNKAIVSMEVNDSSFPNTPSSIRGKNLSDLRRDKENERNGGQFQSPINKHFPPASLLPPSRIELTPDEKKGFEELVYSEDSDVRNKKGFLSRKERLRKAFKKSSSRNNLQSSITGAPERSLSMGGYSASLQHGDGSSSEDVDQPNRGGFLRDVKGSRSSPEHAISIGRNRL